MNTKLVVFLNSLPVKSEVPIVCILSVILSKLRFCYLFFKSCNLAWILLCSFTMRNYSLSFCKGPRHPVTFPFYDITSNLSHNMEDLTHCETFLYCWNHVFSLRKVFFNMTLLAKIMEECPFSGFYVEWFSPKPPNILFIWSKIVILSVCEIRFSPLRPLFFTAQDITFQIIICAKLRRVIVLKNPVM